MRFRTRTLAGSTRAGAGSAPGLVGVMISGGSASASRIQRGQPAKSNPGCVDGVALPVARDEGVPFMGPVLQNEKPATDCSARVLRISMMPLCQCFARRVKADQQHSGMDASGGREALLVRAQNCQWFQSRLYCAWGCFRGSSKRRDLTAGRAVPRPSSALRFAARRLRPEALPALAASGRARQRVPSARSGLSCLGNR